MESLTDQSSINLLQTKRYGLYWISSLLSNIGTWMQQVAQPWIVLSISNSSTWVGIDSFALNAPSFIFTLWGGVLADRYDKKKIILFFQTIQFLSVLILIALFVTKLLHVWMIVLISFVVGTTDSLSMPSFQSIIPSLVKPRDISRAVALNSTQFNLSRILGPAIAGVIMVKFGALTCFGANAFSYIPFFLSLYWIYPKSIPKNDQKQPPVFKADQFKKILLKPEIRSPLMTVFVTSMFCAPLITFCPVIVKDLFNSGANVFGGIMAAFGVGGVIGAALSFIPFPQAYRKDKFSTTISIFSGIVLLCVALNRSLILLYILVVLAGMALTMSNVAANSFVQETASNQERGRVTSFFQLALRGGISGGSLLTGFAISKLGIPTTFIINGSLAIVFQCWILCSNRTTRHPNIT